VWLVLAGTLWLIAGLPANNLTIDAMLHAIFLGFVFSMIFGHAPIILPALLPVDITYRSIFYLPLVLMQSALIVRAIADLTLNLTLRQWAGLFNVLAILLFIGVMVFSARRRPQNVARAV
jgi:nitrite reductase (NO-forming)